MKNLGGFFCLALLMSCLALRVWALAYSSDGQLLKPSIQGPWTLGGVEITGIVVAEPGIEIRGNRMGALFKDGKLSFMKVGKLQMHIVRDNPEKKSDAAIRHIFIDPKEDLRP